ncbi:hypothetical protein TetV_321 [Tetraselmis virus 1]|uniref:DUF4325 domain-containing protein n=1 Tax=Tetraselmis virus 1 TaxID=2060617 RepID=A0A2P0VNE6_9VIRU|nr:hypothetical protein QJ968_gp321 [Tetraselmis virus 1]AUF82413.1 hypothetical protein TetV_321 [Tetraselmis virus 1]
MVLVSVQTPDMKFVKVFLKNGFGARADFDGLKNLFTEMYKRLYSSIDFRIVFDFDFTNTVFINPVYVLEWADLYKKHLDFTNQIVDKTVIRVRNPVVHQAVDTFLSLYPSQRPIEIIKC